MTTVLFIMQAFIVLMLIGVILLQKTGTDSLAGLSGGGHNAFSSKASSDLLTKLTTVLAIAFMVNCLIIAKVSVSKVSSIPSSIADTIPLIDSDEPAIDKTPDVPVAQ